MAHESPLLVPTRSEDLAQPLRARLIEMCCVMIVLVCITVAATLAGPFFRPLGLINYVALFLTPAGYLAALLFLLRTPQPTVRTLRIFEMVLLVASVVLLSFRQYDWLVSKWYAPIAGPHQDNHLMLLLGDDLAIPWLILIILYGTYIPNAWQRCAAVVGTIAALPIILTVVFALSRADEHFHLAPILRRQAVLLLFAATVAISSSWKYSALRRETSEARRLGPYQLLEKLGEGGMGEVYRAQHRLLRRPCAIKLIRPERMADPVVLDRFQREVQVLSGLTHWNIVRVFDYGRTPDGVFYYVMEHLAGMDLDRLVTEHGPQSPARVVYVLRQLCSALHEAHANGLIHRDIKPSNIVLTEQGCVHDVAKLMDFGLVQASDAPGHLTQEGLVVGTPLFMSPEQASGGKVDARSDLYSLGLVAYVLLSGRNPFNRDSPRAIFRAQIMDAPPPLIDVCSRVDMDLHNVIMTCLEKEPADRFPDASALEQALAQCSVAGRWTEADAARWWQEHAGAAREASV